MLESPALAARESHILASTIGANILGPVGTVCEAISDPSTYEYAEDITT